MSIGPSRDVDSYPFARLDKAKAKLRERGIKLIDFGVGDPREQTPQLIRTALAESIEPISSYPLAAGLPELRSAISAWISRRFNASISEADIIPTIGAKEPIHSLAAYAMDETRNVVIVPSPAYPVYERGATFHGATLHHLPLDPTNNFAPMFDAVPADIWQRCALLWLNYPNNPTGFTTQMSVYQRASELARQYGFVFASDEAYSEIYFDAPPISALSLADLTNVVVVNTLSKRSCMTGYRSGFIAGDTKLIERIRHYRPSVGATPQEFVQRASVAAWNDEDHVGELRTIWQTKRDVLLSVWEKHGHRVFNDATFFLWVPTPENVTAESFSQYLLDYGLVVSPGTFFGPEGEGFIRMALVPTIEDIHHAASLLDEALSKHACDQPSIISTDSQ